MTYPKSTIVSPPCPHTPDSLATRRAYGAETENA